MQSPELQKEASYVISFSFPIDSFIAQHKVLKLGQTVTLDYRGADCQLCFWGKQQASEEQPLFTDLQMVLGDIIVKLAPFDQMPELCNYASFDWGGVSSEHHLAPHWKLDLQQHRIVYQNLAEKLGPNHAMTALIQKELDKEVTEPASKKPRTSTANFWQATAKSFQKALNEVAQLPQHAEQLTAESAAEAFQGEASSAAASSIEEASGRVDDP